MKNWENPYENWKLEILQSLSEEYKGLERNQLCICNSGKKYKKCCQKTGKNHHEHYKLTFLEKDPTKFTPMDVKTIHSWKN
jgi:hypothetical protein